MAESKISVKIEIPNPVYTKLVKLATLSRMSIRGYALHVIVEAVKEGRVIPLPAEEPVKSHGKARPRASLDTEAAPAPEPAPEPA